MPIVLSDIPELSPYLQTVPFVKQLLDYPERFRVESKKVKRILQSKHGTLHESTKIKRNSPEFRFKT